MAWIEPEAITDLIGDTFDEGLIDMTIDHAQTLAEIEIGEYADIDAESPGETPIVTRRIKAVLTDIVVRMLRSFEEARVNPAGISQAALGTSSFSVRSVAGLGLTNAEKKLLRKAAGLFGIGVLRTTRGDLETSGPPFSVGPVEFE